MTKFYITPASGVGGEFPTPICFNMRHYSRAFINAYAESCRSAGQKVRIVWSK